MSASWAETRRTQNTKSIVVTVNNMRYSEFRRCHDLGEFFFFFGCFKWVWNWRQLNLLLLANLAELLQLIVPITMRIFMWGVSFFLCCSTIRIIRLRILLIFFTELFNITTRSRREISWWSLIPLFSICAHTSLY